MSIIYNDEYFASFIDFETAKTGEYIHTYKSLINCINHPEVEDVCWLDDLDGHDEIINCTLLDSDTSFNILVPKSLFNYEDFKGWCKKNIDKIWKDERHPNNTRGITYF